MATATLNLAITIKRMLSKTEAANYCGLPMKHFETACPVRPVCMANRELRWDMREIDLWLDHLKVTTEDESVETIVARLR